MYNRMKILTVGGDLRQKYMADYLEEYGFEVECYAVKGKNENNGSDLKMLLHNADIIILPLPVEKTLNRLNTSSDIYIGTDEVIKEINSDQTVFGGLFKKRTEELLKKKGCRMFDYYLFENIAIKNTLPTAFGILKVIFDNVDFTPDNSKCAVFGYGRVGKTTAEMLHNLSADVTVYVRKKSDAALAEINGLKSVLIDRIEKSDFSPDIIINTVPSVIINENILRGLNKSCLIIDVASAPYGTDFAAAERCEIKALQCPSLPGRHFPKTAGKIIADEITDILKEDFYARY